MTCPKRVVPHDGLYGLIVTQTELDLISAFFGQMAIEAVPQEFTLYRALHEHENCEYDLEMIEPGGTTLTVMGEDSQERVKERLAVEHAEHFPKEEPVSMFTATPISAVFSLAGHAHVISAPKKKKPAKKRAVHKAGVFAPKKKKVTK